MPAVLRVVLTLGLMGAASLAHAQAYPCPTGPGAGEVQVGVSGGSHGVAATPMCAPSGGSGGSMDGGGGVAPVSRTGPGGTDIPVDNYFAVAAHPALADVWATSGQYRLEAAEIVVLDACRKTLGDGCEVLVSGRNLSVSVMRDGDGRMHAATAADRREARRAVKALCDTRGVRCSQPREFDAAQRSEPAISAAMLRDDFDRDGLFKQYHFPPSSKVPVPRTGPDAGYGAGANVAARLPEIPGLRTVHHSKDGTWLLRAGDGKGMGCSLSYFRDDQRVLFFGPTATQATGMLMLSSAALPRVDAPRETTAAMSGDRGTVDVRVVLMPVGGTDAPVMVMPTDVPASIASLSDSSPVAISLDGKEVIKMQIEGGAKAKAAMQQCMAGS